MIFKFLLISALVAVTASGSALKGREEGALKGGLKSPVEQQRLIEQHQVAAAKSTKIEYVPVREEVKEQYQKKEEVPLVAEHRNEENLRETQQREEADLKAPLKYEARPQVSRDELSKTNNKYEQREEKFEQKQQEEPRYEQFSQQRDIDQAPLAQQQVELKEEQRRLVDEQPALIQPVLPLAVVEESRSEQLQSVKGGFNQQQQIVAPLGEAEPYAFSYDVEGSSRSESGDTKGVVRGQYTLQNPDGSNRVVDYIADHQGFRASVNTNEFGTEAKSPASVALRTSQPTAEEITLRSEGKTRESLPLDSNYGGLKGAPLIAQKPLQFIEVKTKPCAWCNLPSRYETKGGLQQPPVAQGQVLINEGAKKGELKEIKREPLIETSQKLVREEQRVEELPRPSTLENYPAKSAELKAPRVEQREQAELKYSPGVQQRSGFESATAHRVYRQPVAVASGPVRPLVVPGVPVRAHPPPVVRGPVPLSRVHHQYEHYPASPVQGYRRAHRYESVVPNNPRVSFYGSNYDEDHSSFEHPDSQ